MSSEDDFCNEEAMKVYMQLMHELYLRLDNVWRCINGNIKLSTPFAYEYSFLQFRYMCELIALGCLHLHGDTPVAKTRNAKKEWNATKIMNMLNRYYPHSFPQSVDRKGDEKNVTFYTKPNALTHEEFKSLYARCGDILHRGKIRTINPSQYFGSEDLTEIVKWNSKFIDLMGEHLVSRADGNGFFFVSLRTSSGYPECSMFVPNEAGGFDVSTRKMKLDIKFTIPKG